jgi:hypothetical protein
MEVRRKSEVAVGPLDGGHGAGFTVGQAARKVALAIPARHGIGEDAQDLAE